ncbi:response regulator [Chromatium okenii]|uniref:Response regulatory domain-containing protein n=1 Tax=Chromatium okenii TaxID=61644 RepID=A0A2S7XSS4_9GAMM|nr:response regulator [Chromatium okenii]PQJ96794.1 hypothetical protein CXB77_05735 [Chromatium okenii]
MRSLLSAYLDDVHHLNTVETGSFAEAERELKQDATRFFTAVLDLHLPDAPHGEVVDLLRRYHIPVVVLTGSLDMKQREMMLSKQVVDYFIKHNRNEIEQSRKRSDGCGTTAKSRCWWLTIRPVFAVICKVCSTVIAIKR